MRPLHRHAEPIVTWTPSPRTCKDIVLTTGKETTVYTLNIISHVRIVRCREIIVGLDIDNIHHILRNTMTERAWSADKALIVRIFREVFVEFLFRVNDRTNLKEIEIHGLVALDIRSKLNLHRTAHSLRTELHSHLHQLWYRRSIILEYSCKGY